MKKVFGAIVGFGLVLASAIPAFAAGNNTTGPLSWNFVVGAKVKLARTNVMNFGAVNQTVTSNATSGNNQSNGNTVGNGSDVPDPSGNAKVNGLNEVILNTSKLTINQNGSSLCPDCPSGVKGQNKLTGPGSINVVADISVKAASVNVFNSGFVTQTVTSNANSGNNTSNGNTVGGGINTGKAVVNQTVTTILNGTEITVEQ